MKLGSSAPRKIKHHSSSSALKPVTSLCCRRPRKFTSSKSRPRRPNPSSALQSPCEAITGPPPVAPCDISLPQSPCEISPLQSPCKESAPPPEALQLPGRCASLSALQKGNKPYSMDRWIPTHVWEPDRFETQRKVLSSLPITLKDTLLLPDHQICSILEPSPVKKATSIRKGRPREGVVLVYGKCLHRRPERDFDMSSSLGCSRLFHDCSYKFTNDGALFILLVPSDEVINHLSFRTFADRIPCVVVTAAAAPELLNQMGEELGIPVLALLSTDSKSLGMLASYGRSLKENFKWLGIRPTEMAEQLPPLPHSDRPDYDFLALEPFCPPAMTENDIKSATALSEDDYINTRWAEEFRVMRRIKYKIEVERLVCVGELDYLVDWYLPMKLQTQDWI